MSSHGHGEHPARSALRGFEEAMTVKQAEGLRDALRELKEATRRLEILRDLPEGRVQELVDAASRHQEAQRRVYALQADIHQTEVELDKATGWDKGPGWANKYVRPS